MMPYARSAALALVAGCLAGLATMVLHPTGHDVVRNASAGASNALNVAVHALALVAQPLLLAGTLALTLALRTRRDLAVGGYVFYAVAAVAVMVAAVASGFIAPATVRGLGEADAARRAGMLGALGYTGLVNQAFATVHVLLAGVAFLLWSWAVLAGGELPRGLGVYGIVLGLLHVAGIASGRLRLDIHGFGLVVLGQGVWLVWAAAALWRRAAAPTAAG